MTYYTMYITNVDREFDELILMALFCAAAVRHVNAEKISFQNPKHETHSSQKCQRAII